MRVYVLKAKGQAPVYWAADDLESAPEALKEIL